MIAILFLVSSCAGIWQPAPKVLESRRWSVQTPEGWMRMTTPTYEMLSRDGPYLQYIFIQEQPLSNKTRYTERKMNAAMLPHEAAEVIADALKSDPKIRKFRLLSNRPTIVGGEPGFRLAYTYTDNQGVELKSLYYGVILDDAFFNIRYTAALRYYFAKDVGDFRLLIKSLQFDKT